MTACLIKPFKCRGGSGERDIVEPLTKVMLRHAALDQTGRLADVYLFTLSAWMSTVESHELRDD